MIKMDRRLLFLIVAVLLAAVVTLVIWISVKSCDSYEKTDVLLRNVLKRLPRETSLRIKKSILDARAQYSRMSGSQKWETVFQPTKTRVRPAPGLTTFFGMERVGPAFKTLMDGRFVRPTYSFTKIQVPNLHGILDDWGRADSILWNSIKISPNLQAMIASLTKIPVIPSLPPNSPTPPKFPFEFSVTKPKGKKNPIILIPGIMASNLWADWNIPSAQMEAEWDKMLRTDFGCGPCQSECIPRYCTDLPFFGKTCTPKICIPAVLAHPINCTCQGIQALVNAAGDLFNKAVFEQSGSAQSWINVWHYAQVKYFKNEPEYLFKVLLKGAQEYHSNIGVQVTAWKDQSEFPGLASVKGLKSPANLKAMASKIYKILGIIEGLLNIVAIVTLSPALITLLIALHDKLDQTYDVIKKIATQDYIVDVFGTMIKFLEAQGYVEMETLFGAPYDWRIFPDKKYTNLYFFMLKNLIEQAVKSNQKRAIIVAHSLGGVVIQRFLSWWLPVTFGEKYAFDWKSQCIACFAPINVPFGGAPKVSSYMISGATVQGVTFQPQILAAIGGLQVMAPSPLIMPDAMKKGNVTYPYVNDQLLTDSGLSYLKPYYANIHEYQMTYQHKPPGVKVHSFSSANTKGKTAIAIEYGNTWTNPQTVTEGVDGANYYTKPMNATQQFLMGWEFFNNVKVGDGSVPYISQIAPVMWKQAPYKNVDGNGHYLPVTVHRIIGVEHTNILYDQEFFKILWTFIGSYTV